MTTCVYTSIGPRTPTIVGDDISCDAIIRLDCGGDVFITVSDCLGNDSLQQHFLNHPIGNYEGPETEPGPGDDGGPASLSRPGVGLGARTGGPGQDHGSWPGWGSDGSRVWPGGGMDATDSCWMEFGGTGHSPGAGL